MSVNEAIERLEGVHELRGGLTPLFRESAAMLREAKEIIGYFVRDGVDMDGLGMTSRAVVKERAQRWLKE